MDIVWYGHSCFRLSERGKITIVTDPYSESIGYSPLNVKADVVTISHETPGHAYLEGVRDWSVAIERPGEYEIGGVFIMGFPLVDKKSDQARMNVAYTFDFGNLSVVHLGDLAHVPSQSDLDNLGQVNVLMIPVGGGEALSATDAAEVVAMIEPAIVIPMHYQTPHSLLPLEPVEKFLLEMGVNNPTEEETLRVSASSLPEQTQVVVLGYKG
ncbi:MAG: MBL fold metallo-hydrolase [Anaerolineales bacterium]